MSMRLVVLCFVTAATYTMVLAQDAVQPVPNKPLKVQVPKPNPVPMQAIRRLPAFAVARSRGNATLADLVQAKLSGGEPKQLILMLEAFRETNGDATVTRVRQEQRTREVVVDGKNVKQTYTVSIPFTEVVKNAKIPVPAGIKPQAFDVAKFDFYDLVGEAISIDDAAQRLGKLTSVFLLDNCSTTVKGFSDIQQQAMSKNCIIISTAEDLRKQSGDVFRPILQVQPAR
ncbi:MAG: hypothetical protein WBD20_19605 [Pirellulaceae bacterium]